MRHVSTTYILVWSALVACLTACTPDAEQLESQLEKAEATLSAGNTADAERLFLKLAETIVSHAEKPLTLVDKRYMLCFIASLKPAEIATLFNIEPASIYTVRYRIKKKFPNGYPLPF